MSDLIADIPSPAPVCFADERELRAVLSRPGLMAVWVRRPREPWLEELETAVETGRFQLPRSELDGMSLERIARWLERHLPRNGLSAETRDTLLSDILGHCHLLEDVVQARALRMRIFTGAPDRRCGFHVDTVRPGSPIWGVLRVYNGAVTRWIAPDHIRAMQDFYRWLHGRDRAVRELAGDPEARDERLAQWDTAPSFLTEQARIQAVPADVTVVFRHLDASVHWDSHKRTAAWIHCSPMHGLRRLVLNLSPCWADQRTHRAESCGRSGKGCEAAVT